MEAFQLLQNKYNFQYLCLTSEWANDIPDLLFYNNKFLASENNVYI